MKRSTCALPLLAAVVAVLVLPSIALAADVYHFRGKTASAEFFSVDPTGCISTSVTVYANESRSLNQQGPSVSSAWADVSIYQFDSCTWTDLICAYGSAALPAGSLNVANNLASGSLQATLETYDYCNGTSQPATFAVNWTGVGEAVRGRQSYSYHYPGYHTSYHQNGLSSNATATGSLTFGGTAVPLENGNGYLSSASSGSVYSYH
jgi:hypothetical protein